MNPVTIGQMQEWAISAHIRFQEPELQWLEDLNEANVLYYRFLFRLAQRLQPAVALELGVARAQASAHIAAGGAKVMIGIDRQPFEPQFSANVAAMGAQGLDYRFILGDTTEPEVRKQVIDLVRRYGPIELLFIDSTHLYWYAKKEWETYQGMVAEGAVVVMDDILDPPNEVYRAFAEIPGQHINFPYLHIAGRGSVGFGAIIYGGGDHGGGP